MKFSVNTKKFTQSVNSIVSIFQKSSMLSSNGNDILIIAEDGFITIESANQGMYIKAKIEAEVIDSGSFCVSSQMLTSLKLIGKDASFDSVKSGNKVSFNCGKFSGKFNTSQSNKIIDQRPVNIETDISIPLDPLKKGMSLVMFTPNAAMPILPLNIKTDNKGIVLSTYDTTCATYYQSSCNDLKDIDIMVPAQFMSASFDKFGTSLDIGFTKKLIKISSDTFVIYHPTKQNFSKFNVVEYYESLQKKIPALSFKCKAADWIDSIQSVSSLTAGVGVSDNELTVNIEGSTAVININSEVGEATSDFEVTVDKCDKNSFKISSQLFIDFLNHVKKEEITVSLYPQVGFKKILIENDSISYLLPLKE